MAISDTEADARQFGLSLREQAALSRAPKLKPEQQFWNLPAKLDRARQIGREEDLISRLAALARGIPSAHNNELDARRHARWSERMAQEIDPVTSLLVGFGHELEGSLSRRRPQPRAEALMDAHNNAEGRQAARERRPIDPGRLQTSPQTKGPSIGHGF